MTESEGRQSPKINPFFIDFHRFQHNFNIKVPCQSPLRGAFFFLNLTAAVRQRSEGLTPHSRLRRSACGGVAERRAHLALNCGGNSIAEMMTLRGAVLLRFDARPDGRAAPPNGRSVCSPESCYNAAP